VVSAGTFIPGGAFAMKKKDPALWAACRVHRILADAHCRAQDNSLPSLSTLLMEQKAVERGWRMYQKAIARRWPHVERILRRQASVRHRTGECGIENHPSNQNGRRSHHC
jgi:hypothetical protein